jgi:hypothetical protein
MFRILPISGSAFGVKVELQGFSGLLRGAVDAPVQTAELLRLTQSPTSDWGKIDAHASC